MGYRYCLLGSMNFATDTTVIQRGLDWECATELCKPKGVCRGRGSIYSPANFKLDNPASRTPMGLRVWGGVPGRLKGCARQCLRIWAEEFWADRKTMPVPLGSGGMLDGQRTHTRCLKDCKRVCFHERRGRYVYICTGDLMSLRGREKGSWLPVSVLHECCV